jgi:hypothetical protein
MPTEKREASNFNQVVLQDIGHLVITQGETEALTVEADQDLLAKIITEVRGETLYLSLGKDWLDRLTSLASLFENRQIKYYLTLKTITGVQIAGKGSLEAASLQADRLELKIDGMGEAQIGALTCQRLEVHIGGTAKINVSGQATEQAVWIAGMGEYRAPKLEGKKVDLHISGQGNATVWAQESLDVNITGIGRVEYYGSPRLNQSIQGMGSIKQIG